MNPQPPPAAPWTPPAQIRKPASGPLTAVALIVIGLIATAAFVVGTIALTRPASEAAKGQTPATPTPTFTPEQIASAKKELCSVYQVAARSVSADTNGTDVAIARVSLANAAGMLDTAADNPALGQGERDAARRLASAYHTYVAVASVSDKASPLMQNALDEANHADTAMAAMCP